MSASAALTPRQVFHTLDAISRTRALSVIESLALERAIAQLDAGNERPRPDRLPWRPHELDAVRLAIGAVGSARPGRPPPGFVNPAKVLAPVLGRSEEAVEQCIKRLRGAESDQQQDESRVG